MEGPFLAVDWGTSNLRAWRLGADGAVLRHAELPLGVSRLTPGEAAARFESEVRPALGAEGLPALMCGMVGSTLGWTLAPYIACPASLGALAGGLVEAAPGVRIVPGLTGPGLIGPDVMRGEETQVLGWLAADPARGRGRRLLLHPGTHAKWVRLADGAVERFVTAMTGEIYAVMGAHGVLKFAQGDGPVDFAAFDRGVAAAGDGGALAARLFGVRGLTVSGELAAGAVPAFVSGLLIGAEIAALWPLLADADENVIDVVGDEGLCALYARVLARRGLACAVADGEGAVLAGLRRIWRAAR